MSFIGIDVSKETLEVAALGSGGEVQCRSFDNSRTGHEHLVAWLQRLAVQGIVMEATGSYHRSCNNAYKELGCD